MDLVSDRVRSIIAPPLEAEGIAVVKANVIFLQRNARVEILLERVNGDSVTLDECQKATRIISTHLDVEDPIEGAYILEISSAGVDRPLMRKEDYPRFVGKKINLRTHSAIGEQKIFSGILSEVSESGICLKDELQKKEVNILWENIKKAKLDLDFMLELKAMERKTSNES